MLRLLLVIAALGAVSVVMATATPVLADSHTQTANLRVDGMVCPLCEQTVQSVLTGLPGVESAKADRHTTSALVRYDPSRASPEQMVQAINSQTYYRARVTAVGSGAQVTATAVIKVEGMTDQQTASRVTGTLLLDGIVDGSTNLQDSTLTIVYDTTKLTAQRIVETLQQAVPNDVSVVSVSGAQTGGSLFTSAWFILLLVGLVIVAVFAWPALSRRLQAAPAGSAGGMNRSRRRRNRRR